MLFIGQIAVTKHKLCFILVSVIIQKCTITASSLQIRKVIYIRNIANILQGVRYAIILTL